MIRRYHWSVDLGYWVEVKVGRLWHRIALRRSDGVTAGPLMDEVVCWPQRLRYRQERKHPAAVR